MKRILAILLCALLIIPTISVTAFAENEVTFKDVDGTSTQGQAIIKLATAGVLLGYPDGTFKPNQPITRGELSKVINKIFKYTEADTEMFPDVDKDKDWYYGEVAIAKKAGYIKGYDDGTFRGENNMTREEACTILTRVGAMYDLGLVAGVSDTVSEWAVPYVNMVITGGFMSLEAGNVFRATEKITRGEFCEAFSKFVQIEEIEPDPVEDKKENEKENNSSSNNSSSNSSSSNSSSSSSESSDSSEDDSDNEYVEDGGDNSDNGDYDGGDVDYEALNAETVENLEKALNEINEKYEPVKDYEFQLVAIVTGCIQRVLECADEQLIDDDSINVICKDEITKARGIWKGLDGEEKDSFIRSSFVDTDMDMSVVYYMCKLLGIDESAIPN